MIKTLMCFFCEHYNFKTKTCSAYLDGVSDEILAGKREMPKPVEME